MMMTKALRSLHSVKLKGPPLGSEQWLITQRKTIAPRRRTNELKFIKKERLEPRQKKQEVFDIYTCGQCVKLRDFVSGKNNKRQFGPQKFRPILLSNQLNLHCYFAK